MRQSKIRLFYQMKMNRGHRQLHQVQRRRHSLTQQQQIRRQRFRRQYRLLLDLEVLELQQVTIQRFMPSVNYVKIKLCQVDYRI